MNSLRVWIPHTTLTAERMRSEHELRGFIEGAITADGFKAFLYQVARVMDKMAEEILKNGHSAYEAEVQARQMQHDAGLLWGVLHKAKE